MRSGSGSSYGSSRVKLQALNERSGDFGDRALVKAIGFTTFGTDSLALFIKQQFMAKFTHPAHLPGRIANDQGVVGDLFGDHRTCANECKLTDIMPAHNGSIGSNAGAPAHPGLGILPASVDRRSGVDNISKNAGWTQKNIVIADDAGVETNIVLNFDIGTKDHSW